jgi:type IV secretion system protein VirB1
VSTSIATLIALCAPLVHPVTMAALLSVESAADPYAISINYPERLARVGRAVPVLEHQPNSAREAVAWTRWFLSQGYTVSIGIAQINVERLAYLKQRKAVRDLTELFDPCTNLRAAQEILLDCWQQDRAAGGGRGRVARTLSCFNSGDPRTGFKNGYVRRVALAAARTAPPARRPVSPGS